MRSVRKVVVRLVVRNSVGLTCLELVHLRGGGGGHVGLAVGTCVGASNVHEADAPRTNDITLTTTCGLGHAISSCLSSPF